MVAMPGFGQDHSTLQVILQRLADHIVIDTPPFVIGTGISAITPPGILMRFLVEMAETVYKTCAYKIVYPRSFYWQKPGYIGIADGIVNINGPVTDIVVARNHQPRSVLLQPIDIVLEIAMYCSL